MKARRDKQQAAKAQRSRPERRSRIPRAAPTIDLAAIVDSSDDAIIGKRLDGTIVSWNAGAERLYGYTAGEVIGRPVAILAPAGQNDEITRLLAKLRRGGRVDHLETVRRCKDGRLIDISLTISPVRDSSGRVVGAATIARDITGRKRQEREIQRLSRLYRALSQVNQAIVRTTGRAELLAAACRELAEHGQFRLVWIGEFDEVTRRVKPVAWAGPDHGFLEGLEIPVDDRAQAQVPTALAVRENRPVVSPDVAAEARVPAWQERMSHYGFQSAAAFPIAVEGRVCGNLTVYAPEPGHFRGREVNLLEEVAGDVGFALGHLEAEAQRQRLAARNRQLATIVEVSDDAIVSRTLDGRVTSWNRGAERIYGYTEAEALGQPIALVIPPGREAELDSINALLLRGESTTYFETVRRRKDGSEVAVSVTVSPLRDADGRVFGAASVARDITARKQAEAQLRLAHARLRRLVDANIVGILVADTRGRVFEANDYYLELIGFSRAELDAGRVDWRSITPPEWLPADERALRELQERGTCTPYEKEYVRRDGTRVPVLLADALLPGPEGQIAAFALDLTQRKRAETALRSNEERLRSLFANMLNGFAYCRMEYRDGQPSDFVYLAVNPAFEKLTGLKDVVGRRVSEVIPGIQTSDPQLFERYGRVARTGVPERFEVFVQALAMWFEIAVYQPEPDCFVAVFDVITERRRAEERIREQAALLDRATDAIYVTTLDCAIEYWNAGAERIYGWTAAEAAGRKTTELISAGENLVAEALTRTLEKGEWSGERRQVTKAGRPVDVLSRLTLLRDGQGRPQSILVINADITEKKLLETRFLRAQRLESIGALASGIAHDLNNVLAPIVMSIPLLRESVRDDTARSLVAMVETSAHRGADIVRQVLTFARGSEGERVQLQPKHLVRDMLKLARETFPKNIQVENRSAADVWYVEGDATQLHQALMNLCVNARDAMPEGGRLVMGAENVVLDEAAAGRLPGARAGRYVRLRVADTGAGIPPEHQDKIFDPFFTTKGPGLGTGLGLATVLGVAKGHGGFVRVESEVGRGSTFELYLPATTATPAPAPSATNASLPPWPRAEGERLLLVDDEAAVRAVARQALEEFGYRVICAGSGAEAVQLYEGAPGDIRLVLTDMMMPEMDGPKLVQALRAVDPAVRIVGITGVADAAAMEKLRAQQLAALLAKPFTIGQLVSVVREALGAPGGPRP